MVERFFNFLNSKNGFRAVFFISNQKIIDTNRIGLPAND